jgi:hypothetical protein
MIISKDETSKTLPSISNIETPNLNLTKTLEWPSLSVCFFPFEKNINQEKYIKI